MKGRRILKSGGALVFGLVLLLSVWVAASGAPAEQAVLVPATARTVGGRPAAMINEVSPIAAGGEAEWVELRCAVYARVFLPLVLRSGSTGGARLPVGSNAASGTSVVDISGWQLSDEDGNSYSIPDPLPALPPGAYVVVYFDGLGAGADDYDFSDGVAVLHSESAAAIFEDDADQVALYAEGSIVDFVAYGGLPGPDGDAAAAAGLWHGELYVAPTEQVPGGEALGEGGSVGLYPDEDKNAVGDWVLYGPDEVSPGARNPAPAPYFGSPPSGIETTDRRIAFGWADVPESVGYQFQLAATQDFAAPVFDVVQVESTFIPPTDLADGTYYFRVRSRQADGSWSAYSSAGEVTIFSVARASGDQLRAREVVSLAVTPLLQRKDSLMLCVDGHHRDGNNRWDRGHFSGTTPVRSSRHDNYNCTRASIAMIADYHGGQISQDRISYYKYDGGDPEGDLGHGIGLWPDELCTWGSGVAGDDDVFTWVMQGADIDCGRGKPSFEDVKGWMDSFRPCLFVEVNPGGRSTHSVVVAGYDTEGELVYRINPWTGTGSWIRYSTWNVDEYHCPGQDEARDDEDSLTTDSDSDGIIDFDEQNRFDTLVNDADSDDDGVGDKWDLYEVYFDATGNYAPNPHGADMDGDGLRKEVDPDNDNGGALDGCEDYDRDGRRDLGETSNFSATDDLPCVPVMDSVRVTDYWETVTDTFRPGEAIVLWLVAHNHTPGTLSDVDYGWETLDPSGAPVPDLSHTELSVDMPSGEDRLWWIADGVPDGAAPGVYSYTGSVAYASSSDAKATTFTVSGSPISITLVDAVTCKDVEGNLPVSVTDTFDKSEDDLLYAWALWEGATRPGEHTVEWGFHRPDGSAYTTITHPFTPTVSVYYTWAWLNTEYMYSAGTWTVTVYLDGLYLTYLNFDLASGSAASVRAGPVTADVVGSRSGSRPSQVALDPATTAGARRETTNGKR